MSPEEYQKQMAELGVDRGAFSDRFKDSSHGPGGNPALSKEKGVNTAASLRLTREALGLPVEDLSHLNPRYHGRSRFGGRKCPNCECRVLKKGERICGDCRVSQAIPKREWMSTSPRPSPQGGEGEGSAGFA